MTLHVAGNSVAVKLLPREGCKDECGPNVALISFGMQRLTTLEKYGGCTHGNCADFGP